MLKNPCQELVKRFEEKHCERKGMGMLTLAMGEEVPEKEEVI
jgi:hypothetical protein